MSPKKKIQPGMKKDQAMKLLICLLSLLLAIVLVAGLIMGSCSPNQGENTTPNVTTSADETQNSEELPTESIPADGVPDWTDPTETTTAVDETEPTGNTVNGGGGTENEVKPTTENTTEPTEPEETDPIISNTEPTYDAEFNFNDLFN